MKILSQLVDAQAELKASDYSTGTHGRFWFNTTSSLMKFDDGSAVRSIVTTDNTQTLTNKTLTGNIAVTLVSGAATLTLPTTTGTLATLANTETLTNKTLTGNIAVTLVSGAATLTLPTTTGTLATLANAEVFTNKDYDGGVAANTRRFTFPSASLATISALTRKEATVWYATDTDKLYKDDGTSLTEIGSGSSGSINYITNPDAESGTTGWAAYADAAATSPVDGTGGSPTVTITRTTTTPLRGTGSFLITKDAANRQGEGVGYAFTIDSADKAKVLNISFDYEIASGTFASGDSSDVRVFVYDVTNTVLIPVSPNTIQGGSSNQFKFTGTFQTASNSTSYRLIIHCATTSASAYTFEFDNVVVGPQIVNYGAPIGDWTSYTPSSTQGFGTISSGEFFYRRIGDSVHVRGRFTAGTVTGDEARISLPTGMTIDSTKVDGTANVVGSAVRNSANAEHNFVLAAPSVTYFNFSLHNASSHGLTFAVGTTLLGNGAEFSFFAVTPISGWSSTVLMSNDTDTRVVAMRASGNAAAMTSPNPIILPTADYDTHAAYSVSTGLYTVPVSGYYDVSGYIDGATSADALNIYVNSVNTLRVATAESNGTAAFSAQVKVTAGQTIHLSSAANNINAGANSFLSIRRVSGPSAVAATESVNALAETNTARAITNNAATTAEFLCEDEIFDSHGAYSITTAVFTVPVSGKYRVSAYARATATAGWEAGEQWQLQLFKNASLNRALGGSTADSTHSQVMEASGCTIVSVVAGDTLEVRIFQNSDGAVNTDGTAANNWVCYERIGN